MTVPLGPALEELDAALEFRRLMSVFERAALSVTFLDALRSVEHNPHFVREAVIQ
jgi:hypothetical protein